MTLRILAILSPVLVGLLPVLSLFEKNPGEVWFTDFLFLSSFIITVILLILTTFFLVKRNLLHASLSTIMVFIPLTIVNETYSYSINVIIWILGLVVALIFLSIGIRIDLLKKLHKAVFFPLFILAVFLGFSVAFSKGRIIKAEKELEKKLNLEFSELKRTQKSVINSNPDIYFIILDEFISLDAFRNYYQYDNDNFFSFLESSGFHLVGHSYSNYPWTIPSISSIASLNYHKNWVLKKEFPQLAHTLVRYNMGAKLLESEGYHTYSIPSIYWFGNASKGCWKDFLFRAKSYGLTMSVLRSTPLANIAREYQRVEHKNHINFQLAQLEEISKKQGQKKFIFTHFLCPHRPIVFDREGKDLEGVNIVLAESDKQHHYYLDQAYFISSAIQNLVKTILASSNTPPVIIIVSDHGKFPIGSSGKGKTTLPLPELSWRLSNFIAIHFPDSSMEFPEFMTVVNVFRLLLSHNYGYDLPPLDNICHTDFFNLETEEHAESLIPFQSGAKMVQ